MSFLSGPIIFQNNFDPRSGPSELLDRAGPNPSPRTGQNEWYLMGRTKDRIKEDPDGIHL